MKAVNLMPPTKRKVVAGVASFALACSMMPTAGVAWAAETTEEPTEATELAPEAPSTLEDGTPEDSEKPETDPEEETADVPETDSETSTPPSEDPVEEEESLTSPQLEEPAEATVAEVNGEAFATVKDALMAAPADSVVTLTADATLDGDQFGITKNITLDLSGYTLYLQNALFTTAGTNVIIKDGTIVANDAPKTALIIKGEATLQNVKMQATGSQPAVKADAGATLTLAQSSINAQADALIVDGAASVVKVKQGSSVASTQGPAIKVEGKNGGSAQIDVAGMVNGGAGFAIVLTGASVTEGAVTLTQYSSGKIATNGTLATRCQLPTATLNMQGGTITSAGRGVKMEAGMLKATGTTFNCAAPIETAGTGTAVVTGGQFQGDVTAFCQAGYAARYDSSTQRFEIVAIGNAVAQILRASDAVLYDDINEALANLQEGDTLNLLASVEVDSNVSTNAGAITLPRLCALNGNGHTITAGTFQNPSHMINVLAGGVTIKDVTIDMQHAALSKHGINLHGASAWANISGVTIKNANTAAMEVNGSAPQGAIVNGLTTSGCAWGAINVDNGGTLTFNSGSLGEDNKIWTETDSGSAITVNAPGFDAITAVVPSGSTDKLMTCYADAAFVEALAVAESNGMKYADLQLAIDRAEAGATVTLLKNVEQNLVINAGQDLTLDFNGCTLNGGKVAKRAALTNYGAVNIIGEGTIKRDDSGRGGYYVIDNQGTMTIQSAAVINGAGINPGWSGASLIRNGDVKPADLTINGGTFQQENFIVVKNCEWATVTINGGTFYGAVPVENWCKATLNGGTFTCSGHPNGSAIIMSSWSDETEPVLTTVNGGSVNGRIDVSRFGKPESLPVLVIAGGTHSIPLLHLPEGPESFIIQGGVFAGESDRALLNDYVVEGKEIKEDGTVGAIVVEPEQPEAPVVPEQPVMPVTPAPQPQPQQPTTQATPNATQNTDAGVRFAPVVAVEEAAEEMGLVAPAEATQQAFASTESIQDADTPMAKEPATVAAEDAAGINWRLVTGVTVVVLLAAGSLLAALCRRKGQSAS